MTIIGIYLPICNALKGLEMATGVTFNHGVAGSSPAGLTNKNNNLGEKSALYLPEKPAWEDHGKKSADRPVPPVTGL